MKREQTLLLDFDEIEKGELFIEKSARKTF